MQWPNKGVKIKPEQAEAVRRMAREGYYPSAIAYAMPELTIDQIKYQCSRRRKPPSKAKAPMTGATVHEGQGTKGNSLPSL